MRKHKLIFFLLVAHAYAVFAQESKFGLYGGINANILAYRSYYEISRLPDTDFYFPSFNLGSYLQSTNPQLNYRLSVEYLRTNNRYEFKYTDFEGSIMGQGYLKSINHWLLLTPSIKYTINKHMFIGTGLTFGLLVRSYYKLPHLNILGESMEKWAKNYMYNDYGLAVPIYFNFQNTEKIYYFMKAEIGLLNKMKGAHFIKEYDNVISIGIGYEFDK